MELEEHTTEAAPLTEEATTDKLSKQLRLVIADLDKRFGKGSVLRLDDAPSQWPSIPTKALTLDMALGIGGIPKGRITEVWGNEGTSKSTLGLTLTANVQRSGGRCAYIDAEAAIDPVYAQALGVDLNSLLFSQPSYGEEGLEIMERLAKTGEVDFIVIDSVAALIPKAELEGTMEDQQMGLQARMMSKAMRRLPNILKETGATVLFINQVRSSMAMYGNPNVQPGGKALRFAASVRIQLSKKDDIKNSRGELIGVKIEARVIKNKLAPPLKKALYDVLYGKGIDNVAGLFDMAREEGIITKGGAWFKFQDDITFQGEDTFKNAMREDSELYEMIKKEVENGS